MCQSFQITYFNIQQLPTVLMIALLEHFNLEVNKDKDKIPSCCTPFDIVKNEDFVFPHCIHTC